jgi:glycosyl transferase family 25
VAKAATASAQPTAALNARLQGALRAGRWARILKMTGFQTWVINLDRAPERLARITAQLRRLELPFHRLAAVDARSMTDEQRALLDEPAYRRKHGMSPVLGELGCYLSHVLAMRAFLASDADFALVLEDDVLLTDSLPAVLAGLAQHRSRWDMCKLSAVHSGTPQPFVEVAPGHRLAVMLSRCTGSSAYAINRHAAQAYLKQLLPMSLPYDHVFDQGWRFGLKVRLVTPTPCAHDEAISSTIVAPPGVRRKFSGFRRWPAYAYRLGNELRRFSYGVSQAARERRAS